jgi:hypothetical protein
LVEALEARELLTTFTVTNTNDGGAGSLRQAILDANAHTGLDLINFSIGSGTKTIKPASALPTLTEQVLIDGRSQSGYVDKPLIIIDGSNAGSSSLGLNLTGGNSFVLALSIVRFAGSGLVFQTGNNNVVFGCYLGVDPTGATGAGNGFDGLFIQDSSGNAIGGAPAVDRNIISGNGGFGVVIQGQSASGNTLHNNYIGLQPDGATALANGSSGVVLNSPGNTIGGTTAGSGNVISGNTRHGIEFDPIVSLSNLIQGNLIGTDKTGTLAHGNGLDGIFIQGSSNTIGGTAAGAGNVISGNAGNGVTIQGIMGHGASGNVVLGNRIGTNATGTAALGNAGHGVLFGDFATGSTLGGTVAGARNVVSANGGSGVRIDAVGCLVEGNYIGTNAAGNAALGNGQSGVDARSNADTIGGTAAGAGNLISGNAPYGIFLTGAAATGIVVQGNFIGTNALGTAALPNQYGVVMGSGNNTLGGTAAGARNVISGNTYLGVNAGTASVVQGNFIGTDFTGTAKVPNGLGVMCDGGSTIGGTTPGAGNLISGNGSDGINIFGTGDLIQGNLIGTNAAATAALGNANDGIFTKYGATATIGGSARGAGNVISGNAQNGIEIYGYGAGNSGGGFVVLGNSIGTNAAGTAALGNGGAGVLIRGYTYTNTIGGTAAGAGNLISGNLGPGLLLDGTNPDGNPTALTQVLGNLIGTDVNGSAAVPNAGGGVVLKDIAAGNTIGGTVAGARNVISGNGTGGVRLQGSKVTFNSVVGNYIGTNAAGTAVLGNGTGDGVMIDGAASNTIGGTAAGAGNLISGNANDGVEMTNGAAMNLVQGNLIGTDAAGTHALANGTGVDIFASPNNTVGGTVAGARNLISGNAGSGVVVQGPAASGNLIQGNYIGTNATGAAALGNVLNGVILLAPNNKVGGTASRAGNLISGNSRGVVIGTADGTGNLVQGNFIGTDATGNSALANFGPGIRIDTADNNTIGGAALGAGNLISGNGAEGIDVPTGTGNVIQGNRIGGAAGGSPLGNAADGVAVGNAPNTLVGGTTAGAGNTIAFNGGAGVLVAESQGAGILSNAIFTNKGPGIDLSPSGNNLENAPVLSAALRLSSHAVVSGTLSSLPKTTFRLEFFANVAADPSGFVEGQSYVGTTMVTTDAGGTATFSVTEPATVSLGQLLTATATDPNSNTSEFSRAIRVAAGPPADFDGDGKTDVAIYDQTASQFYVLLSSGGAIAKPFGNPAHTNLAVPGDFDGDGKSDVAIYDQTASQFYVLLSGGGAIVKPFGNPAHLKIPLTGDFDGDGKTDVGIYDETAGQFYIQLSGGGSIVKPFGNPGHVNTPLASDFDGDGKTDVGIYDQTAAEYFVLESGGGTIAKPFGNPAHVNIPIAGDFDGDHKSDIAISDQTDGVLYAQLSGGGAIVKPFGNPAHANIPLAGDYDADGTTDIGVYDQTASQFFVLLSGGGALTPQFGNPAHRNSPMPSAYVAGAMSMRSMGFGPPLADTAGFAPVTSATLAPARQHHTPERNWHYRP